MIVVSDAGPINYLVLIGYVEVLPRLFGQVIIPLTVYEELTRPLTPALVREWMQAKPDWLEVRAAPQLIVSGLDPGETEALSLAIAIKADLMLIDERKGRAVAAEHMLKVIGTLGILALAADAGILDLSEAIERLRQTVFQIKDSLVEAALERDRTRRAQLNSVQNPDQKTSRE
jgi:predicted nucleic acid-binding protein